MKQRRGGGPYGSEDLDYLVLLGILFLNDCAIKMRDPYVLQFTAQFCALDLWNGPLMSQMSRSKAYYYPTIYHALISKGSNDVVSNRLTLFCQSLTEMSFNIV